MEVDLAGRQFVCVTACFQYNRHIKDHEKSEKPAFSFAAQTGWCTDVIENQGPDSDCVAKYQLDEDCFGRKKRVWAALCERRTQSWQRLWQSKWRQLVCGGWCTCYRDLDNMRSVALYIDIESFEPQNSFLSILLSMNLSLGIFLCTSIPCSQTFLTHLYRFKSRYHRSSLFKRSTPCLTAKRHAVLDCLHFWLQPSNSLCRNSSNEYTTVHLAIGTLPDMSFPHVVYSYNVMMGFPR